MSPAGVSPVTDEQLRHRRGAAIGALSDDARATAAPRPPSHFAAIAAHRATEPCCASAA
jgi:hypothetical protein